MENDRFWRRKFSKYALFLKMNIKILSHVIIMDYGKVTKPIIITNNITKIPRIIYQSWYTTDLHPFVQLQIDRMMEKNPTYTHVLFTDQDMETFITENFNSQIVECYHRLNIIVAKVDFWRYLILYHYGGVYVDMDSTIIGSLDNLIHEDDDAIISKENNPYFYVQWGLIFQKNHPILKHTIELLIHNITYNLYPNDIHKMTGPSVFTEAVNTIKKTQYINIYGIDYENYFQFDFNNNKVLFQNKMKWNVEQKMIPLLR